MANFERKQLIGRWNQGDDKVNSRKALLKRTAKSEIDEQLAGDDFRYPHKSYTPNRIAQTENRIDWIKKYTAGRREKGYFFGGYWSRELKRLKKRLAKLRDNG